MAVKTGPTHYTGEAGFEALAVDVLQRLREAFVHLLESLPGPTHRAADLDKALGVSRTLGWQIHKIATSPTALEAGVHVPGMNAVQQVLRAARQAGAPQRQVQDVERAMEAFEAFVDEHAGDRATFTTMINSLLGKDAEAIDARMRRQMFRASSQAWGMQVKTYLACQMILPGKTPDVLDVASIRGLRGIRRLRAGAQFRLTTQRFFDASRHSLEPKSIGEHAPGGAYGPKLLREFCTQPTPELDNRYDGRLLHTYLRETPLGNAGVLDLYLAEITRDLKWQDPGDAQNSQVWFVAIRKPMESLVLDTLIHRDMFSEISWETKVCGSLDRMEEPDPDNFRPEETLPINAEVLDLGRCPANLPTPHVPRYREMVESVCRDIGQNPHDFRLFRCIVEYPLLLSIVSVKFLLPDEGNWGGEAAEG